MNNPVMPLKKGAIASLCYITIGLALCSYDINLLIIWLTLVPVASLFIWISYKIQNLTLSIFLIFFFLAHAIDPLFFFANKVTYTEFGWTAVRNFDFNIIKFLNSYAFVYLLVGVVIGVTIIFDKFFHRERFALSSKPYIREMFARMDQPGQYDSKYSLLFIGSVLSALGLNLWMVNYRIGMTGIDPTPLPFHMAGILFYFRGIVIPIILFYQYMRSSRSPLISMLSLIYSAVSGLVSISRSVMLLAAFPVIFFSIVQRKRITLVASILYVSMMYPIISMGRNYFYFLSDASATDSLLELINSIDLTAVMETNLFTVIIKSLSERLYGAQCIALADQSYDFINRSIYGILNYFRGYPVMENMASDLFGIDFHGMSFGVGIGLQASIVMLANGSILATIFMGTIVAILLYSCELILIKLLAISNPLSFIAFPVGLFGALYLTAGDFDKVYTIISGAFTLLLLYNLFSTWYSHWRIIAKFNSQ